MNIPFFNDTYYKRAKKYVLNTITNEEVELYNQNKITRLYSSFEELLLHNIKYYSRFIRTILWLYENVLIQDGKIITRERKIRYKIPMSCTKIYYIVMCNNDMTRDEIFYGYPQLKTLKAKGKTFKGLFKKLMEIGSFSFNTVYTTEKYETKSFHKALNLDVTNDEYLYKISRYNNDDVLFIMKDNIMNEIGECISINENIINLNKILFAYLQSEKKISLINTTPQEININTNFGNYHYNFNYNEITKKFSCSSLKILSLDNYINKNIIFINKIFKYNNNISLLNLRKICYNMITEFGTDFIAIKRNLIQNRYSICKVEHAYGSKIVTEIFYDEHGNKILQRTKHFYNALLTEMVHYLFNNGYFIFGHSNNKTSLYDLSSIDNGDMILNYYYNFIGLGIMSSKYKLYVLQNETMKIYNFMLSKMIK